MARGTVTHYDANGGYGFLSTPDTPEGDDVFFHVSDVPAAAVEAGWRLEFEAIEGREGLRARDVEIVSTDESVSVDGDRENWYNREGPEDLDRQYGAGSHRGARGSTADADADDGESRGEGEGADGDAADAYRSNRNDLLGGHH